MMGNREALDRFLYWDMTRESKPKLDEQEFQRQLPVIRAQFLANEWISSFQFDMDYFARAPVFVADEIALYQSTFPEGTYYGDVVSSMAPPFDEFFIEFKGVEKKLVWRVDETPEVENILDLRAWGCFIRTIDHPKEIEKGVKEFIHSPSCGNL
jgi:hypothetical protein